MIRFHQQFLGTRILHGLIMSLFPKVFTLHRLLLLSTLSPPSRLFKLDDESSCAVAISRASWWAQLCVFTLSSTLNLKWCGYWMCARFTTLKIGVLWLYTDVFPEGKQTQYQKCVCKASHEGSLLNWSNKCARRSPSEASLVFHFSRRVCVHAVRAAVLLFRVKGNQQRAETQ